MSFNEGSNAGRPDNIEELYAKPYKVGRKQPAPSITSGQSESLYDKLDRSNSFKNSSKRSSVHRGTVESNVDPGDERDISPSDPDNGSDIQRYERRGDQLDVNDDYDDVASSMSVPNSTTSQQTEDTEAQQYPVDILETKDTNEIIKDLRKLGLEDQSDRLILALRNRFELESAFIEVCSNDGVAIVEGDYDDVSNEHLSIGGLRVKGLKPKFVNYDEYDPDIIKKYGHFAQGFRREQMASDAADLRRRAANMLWAVENMERMIDPNSRVKYVRQENN